MDIPQGDIIEKNGEYYYYNIVKNGKIKICNSELMFEESNKINYFIDVTIERINTNIFANKYLTLNDIYTLLSTIFYNNDYIINYIKTNAMYTFTIPSAKYNYHKYIQQIKELQLMPPKNVDDNNPEIKLEFILSKNYYKNDFINNCLKIYKNPFKNIATFGTSTTFTLGIPSNNSLFTFEKRKNSNEEDTEHVNKKMKSNSSTDNNNDELSDNDKPAEINKLKNRKYNLLNIINQLNMRINYVEKKLIDINYLSLQMRKTKLLNSINKLNIRINNIDYEILLNKSSILKFKPKIIIKEFKTQIIHDNIMLLLSDELRNYNVTNPYTIGI